MLQLAFPSTIEGQPHNVTFLTIKTVVRKIKKKRRSDELMCLDRGRGGNCQRHSAGR